MQTALHVVAGKAVSYSPIISFGCGPGGGQVKAPAVGSLLTAFQKEKALAPNLTLPFKAGWKMSLLGIPFGRLTASANNTHT